METTLFTKCLFEFIGTLVLVLLGDGVVASTVLKRSKGYGGGWVVITMAWGLAVMCGVLIAGPWSGAHLNPAVSVGLAVAGSFPWAYVPGYIAAQLLGGFCGAVLVYLYYKDHFDATDEPETKLGVFCALAASVPDTNGVYFVPALTGLAAPHWDQYARGAISGISRGTTAAHIARAALEGIAYQTLDIVGAMQRDAGITLLELKVDGGAARNNLLMQFQSDLLGKKVIRPRVTETTALGAAYLAGLAVGYWGSIAEIEEQWQAEHIFEPTEERTQIDKAITGWEDAVRRVLRGKTD